MTKNGNPAEHDKKWTQKRGFYAGVSFLSLVFICSGIVLGLNLIANQKTSPKLNNDSIAPSSASPDNKEDLRVVGTPKKDSAITLTSLDSPTGSALPQDISLTATPTFASLRLTNALGVSNGGTGAASALEARVNLGAAGSNVNDDITQTTALNTITPSSAFTLGATTQGFTLQGNSASAITATSESNRTTISFATPIANTILTVPALSAGTYSLCTSDGNCAQSGGGVTTHGGTTGRLAVFSGSQALIDSIVSADTTTMTVAGSGLIQGASGQALLSLGIASTNKGKLTFANDQNSNLVTLQAGNTSTNVTYTLPVTDGASGTCLSTNGSGVLNFTPCSGGVSSFNGLIGALALANSSFSGATVHIDDASTIAKGIARFNSTNFSVVSGAVNTIQDISTSSSPTFSALTISNGISAATLSGNGSSVTNVDAIRLNGQLQSYYLNAGNLSTGTLSDLLLSSNVTLQSNSFNGANQLVKLNGNGLVDGTLGTTVDIRVGSGFSMFTRDSLVMHPTTGSTGATIINTRTDGNFGTLHISAYNMEAIRIQNQGRVGIGNFTGTAQLQVQSISTSTVTQAVQAFASQTADILQIQNSSGNSLSGFDAAGNLYMGSGQSIKITGSATFPSSPTEGQLYFRTDNKQLYTYANGKWQADRSSSTLVVAASDSQNKEKADYIGDGLNDQNAINSALSALPATGGSIVLLDGTFKVTGLISIPNNVTILGNGTATVLKIPDATNQTFNVISNSDTSTGTNISLRDFRIDGNRSNQSSGTNYGIYFSPYTNMGGGSGASARKGATIINVSVENMTGVGISVGCNSTVTNSYIRNNATIGLLMAGQFILANGNIIQGNSLSGISTLGGVTDHVEITNNTIQGNGGDGIVVGGCCDVAEVISNNTISENGMNGISVVGSADGPLISSNYIYNNGGSNNCHGIYLANINRKTQIVDNRISDASGTGYAIYIGNFSLDVYLSNNTFSGTGATSINDLATGTIYSSQLGSNGNLIIKPQAGISLNSATTGYSLQNSGAFVQGGLSTPSAPTLSAQGATGATTWGYKVTAYDGLGETLASSETTIANGNATLTGTNFNRITPVKTAGAVSYKIYRTTASGTPSSTGLIGTLASAASTFQFDDTGLATTTGIPTSNSTGIFQAVGSSALFKNSTNSSTAFSVQNTAGNDLISISTLSTTTNLVVNSSFETNISGWTPLGSATLSTSTSAKEFGAASMAISTTAATTDGASYGASLASSTQYSLSFFAKVDSGSLTALLAGWSNNGASQNNCTLVTAPQYTPAISTSWRRYYCTFTTGSVSGSPYIFIRQNDSVARVLYIDAVQLTAGAIPPSYDNGGQVAVNGVVNRPLVIQPSEDTNEVFAIRPANGQNFLMVDTSTANMPQLVLQSDPSQGGMSIFKVTNSSGLTAADITGGGGAHFSNMGINAITNVKAAWQTNFYVLGGGGFSAAVFAEAPNSTLDIVSIRDQNNTTYAGFANNGSLFTNGMDTNHLNLAVPTFSTASTGTNYFYVITAINNYGETVASNSLGMANATSALTWSKVPGATQYKIYRNTTNSFAAGSLLRTTITDGSTVTFTDTGAATSAGLPPTTVTGSTMNLQAWQSQTAALLQAKDSLGNVLASINSTGGLTVASAIINGNITVNGHIVSGGSTPAISAGAAACTTPTVSVSGNDTAGKISVTTGSGCASGGTFALVTFVTNFGTSPLVSLTPVDANSAALQPYADATTSTMTIGVINSPTDSTTYKYTYHVIG